MSSLEDFCHFIFLIRGQHMIYSHGLFFMDSAKGNETSWPLHSLITFRISLWKMPWYFLFMSIMFLFLLVKDLLNFWEARRYYKSSKTSLLCWLCITSKEFTGHEVEVKKIAGRPWASTSGLQNCLCMGSITYTETVRYYSISYKNDKSCCPIMVQWVKVLGPS